MSNESNPKAINMAEAFEEVKERQEKMNNTFEHDSEENYLTIHADGFGYEIDLSRVSNHEELVGWALHLTEKTWMTTSLIGEFIERVCKIKGWGYPQTG